MQAFSPLLFENFRYQKDSEYTFVSLQDSDITLKNVPMHRKYFLSTFEGLKLNTTLFETEASLAKPRSTKIYTYSKKSKNSLKYIYIYIYIYISQI